jgi:hypothetical protein
MCKNKKMNRTTTVLLFFVAAVLAGLFLGVREGMGCGVRNVSVEDMSNPEKSNAVEGMTNRVKETFFQRQVGMPLDMQSVEGATGVAGYSGTPPLLGSEPKPLSEKPYDMANDNELYQFEVNKMGPECCPSPFSGDRGCICLTDSQKAEFASRGGNKSRV